MEVVTDHVVPAPFGMIAYNNTAHLQQRQ